MLQIIGLVWPVLVIGSVAVVAVTGSAIDSSGTNSPAITQLPYSGECKALDIIIDGSVCLSDYLSVVLGEEDCHRGTDGDTGWLAEVLTVIDGTSWGPNVL